jgi:hypothetical protein
MSLFRRLIAEKETRSLYQRYKENAEVEDLCVGLSGQVHNHLDHCCMTGNNGW